MHGHNSFELIAEMLVGKELLDKARSLSNRPEDDIARGCGYVGPSGRLLKKSFYRALVEAKAEAQGWQLPRSTTSGGGSGSRGRQAEFRTRVHGNGNLLIGHAYTKRLGLEPGQEFRIELNRDSRSICLLPPNDETTDRTGDQVQPFSESQSSEMAGVE